jgi:hypothetical protein
MKNSDCPLRQSGSAASRMRSTKLNFQDQLSELSQLSAQIIKKLKADNQME